MTTIADHHVRLYRSIPTEVTNPERAELTISQRRLMSRASAVKNENEMPDIRLILN